MIEALTKLLRLAQLRRDRARAALTQARAALELAHAQLRDAQTAADELAVRLAAERQALRSGTVGSEAVRGALDAVLLSLTRQREREAEAAARVQAAQGGVERARAALEAARQGLVAAEHQLEKRKRLRQPLIDRRAVRLERRDEADAEEIANVLRKTA